MQLCLFVELVTLGCGHVLHSSCLYYYLKPKLLKNVNEIDHIKILEVSCPRCNANLDCVDLYHSIILLNKDFPGTVLKKNRMFEQFRKSKCKIRKLATAFNYALLQPTVKTNNDKSDDNDKND